MPPNDAGPRGGLLVLAARAVETCQALLYFALLICVGMVASAVLIAIYPLLIVFDRRWLVAPRVTCISAYYIGRLFVRMEIEVRRACVLGVLAPPPSPSRCAKPLHEEVVRSASVIMLSQCAWSAGVLGHCT